MKIIAAFLSAAFLFAQPASQEWIERSNHFTNLLLAIDNKYIQQQMAKPNIVYPSRQRLETELARNAVIVSGIADLFKKYQLTGWEDSYATLQAKLNAYDAWVKANVLPKARTDFREPPRQYALALEGFGIDIPPVQVAQMAHAAFLDLQEQMKQIAAQIAVQREIARSCRLRFDFVRCRSSTETARVESKIGAHLFGL